ncbi:MAG TPA: hypothetical protein VJZ68_08235 [Nitrososphaera sp.]|nr:hypothetical protein [Nitrososphaera sp.]
MNIESPVLSMTSLEVEEIMAINSKEQVDLYRQLRGQLVRDVEKYRREGKYRPASIISDSLKEQPRIR